MLSIFRRWSGSRSAATINAFILLNTTFLPAQGPTAQKGPSKSSAPAATSVSPN